MVCSSVVSRWVAGCRQRWRRGAGEAGDVQAIDRSSRPSRTASRTRRRSARRRSLGAPARKARASALRRDAEAVDVVVAVALDVGDAEAGGEQRVLLHREAGLAGEVFAGQQQPRSGLAPRAPRCATSDRSPCRPCSRCRDSRAPRPSSKASSVVVGFVEDHRHVDARSAAIGSRSAMRRGNRLLEQQRALPAGRAAPGRESAHARSGRPLRRRRRSRCRRA